MQLCGGSPKKLCVATPPTVCVAPLATPAPPPVGMNESGVISPKVTFLQRVKSREYNVTPTQIIQEAATESAESLKWIRDNLAGVVEKQTVSRLSLIHI